MAEPETNENSEIENKNDQRIDLHAVETPLSRQVGSNQPLHLERDSRSLENSKQSEDH